MGTVRSHSAEYSSGEERVEFLHLFKNSARILVVSPENVRAQISFLGSYFHSLTRSFLLPSLSPVSLPTPCPSPWIYSFFLLLHLSSLFSRFLEPVITSLLIHGPTCILGVLKAGVISFPACYEFYLPAP